MASVFLSYARDDADKARSVALALEKAGHAVWWDSRISGGSQFAKEIEQALDGADVVVVLWSPSSVESSWVRDEAGSGRDRGRLVPLSLNGTLPPLGFRQFHSIDLGTWRGRGKIPQLKEILAAIDRRADEPGIPAPVASAPAKRRWSGPSLNLWAVIGIALAMFFVVVGLLIGRPWEHAASASVPIVGVEAADDSAGSQRMARALGSNLNSLADFAGDRWHLTVPGAQQRPNLLFHVRDASADGSKISLTLLKGKDRSLLWSRDFDLTGVSSSNIQRQLSLTAARVLGCAAEGLDSRRESLRQETLKLYLTACSKLPEASAEDYAPTAEILSQVVGDAPAFSPGWSKLLLAESQGSANFDPESPEPKDLRQHIERAAKLDPKMAEVAIARAALLPRMSYGQVLQLLDDAHATHPENAQVLSARSGALLRVGRLEEAIADAKQAAQLDPTAPDLLAGYVLALAYAGRIDAAKEQLQRARSLWAGTGSLRDLEYGFLLRFGDPKDLLNTEQFKEAPPAWQMYVRTRIDPSPANVDRFVEFLRQLHQRRGVHAGDVAGHSQPYGEFHREKEIYDMIAQVPPGEDISIFADVAFRPSLRKFRQDPRFMRVAKRIGLVDYWQKSGKWPDFCFVDTDQPYDCKAEAAKLQ